MKNIKKKTVYEQNILLQQAQAFFRSNQTRPKKQLGQHFLINPDVLSIIIEAGEVKSTDVVIEIGAGLGCLTAALADSAKHVVAVEVDPQLASELKNQFTAEQQIEIVQADILEADLLSLIPQGTRPKVVANLPYGITSPILWKLLENSKILDTCILMMQREVAERIVASPGGKDYGALTIGISYYADTTLIDRLSPDNFFPAPKVDSALLKLTMCDEPKVVVDSEDYFFRIVREAFRGRRKMLKNSLRRFASTDTLSNVFAELNIAPQRRAETLDIVEFAALANLLHLNI